MMFQIPEPTLSKWIALHNLSSLSETKVIEQIEPSTVVSEPELSFFDSIKSSNTTVPSIYIEIASNSTATSVTQSLPTEFNVEDSNWTTNKSDHVLTTNKSEQTIETIESKNVEVPEVSVNSESKSPLKGNSFSESSLRKVGRPTSPASSVHNMIMNFEAVASSTAPKAIDDKKNVSSTTLSKPEENISELAKIKKKAVKVMFDLFVKTLICQLIPELAAKLGVKIQCISIQM